MSLHGICTFIWQNEKSGFYNMNKQNCRQYCKQSHCIITRCALYNCSAAIVHNKMEWRQPAAALMFVIVSIMYWLPSTYNLLFKYRK